MFKAKYNPIKLKTNLKVAVKRLQLLEKKQDNTSILARKDISKLLEEKRFEIAKIKVEQLIRDDFYREALEILETYCTLCIARFGLIETVEHCDTGIQKAVCTILWSTPRVVVDVTEFKEISKQLTLRYGKEFKEASMSDSDGQVCDRVKHKLTFVMPEESLVVGYLNQIAQTYGVNVNFPAPAIQSPLDADVMDPTMPLHPEMPSNQFPPVPMQQPHDDMLAGLDFPSPVGFNLHPQQQPQHQQQPQQQHPQQPQQQQHQQPPRTTPPETYAFPSSQANHSDLGHLAFPPSMPTNTNTAYPPETYPPQPYPPESYPSLPPEYKSEIDPKDAVDLPSPFPSTTIPTSSSSTGLQQTPNGTGNADDALANLNQLLPPPGTSGTTGQDTSLDFDDLTRRFDALNKR